MLEGHRAAAIFDSTTSASAEAVGPSRKSFQWYLSMKVFPSARRTPRDP